MEAASQTLSDIPGGLRGIQSNRQCHKTNLMRKTQKSTKKLLQMELEFSSSTITYISMHYSNGIRYICPHIILSCMQSSQFFPIISVHTTEVLDIHCSSMQLTRTERWTGKSSMLTGPSPRLPVMFCPQQTSSTSKSGYSLNSLSQRTCSTNIIVNRNKMLQICHLKE